MAQRCRYRFVWWQLVEYLGEQVPHFGMSSVSVELPRYADRLSWSAAISSRRRVAVSMNAPY